MCEAFKEYKDVPEMLPLDFIEDYVMWVALNLSGNAGALEAELIKLINFLIPFVYVTEELRVFSLDWMTVWITPPPSPPPISGALKIGRASCSTY